MPLFRSNSSLIVISPLVFGFVLWIMLRLQKADADPMSLGKLEKFTRDNVDNTDL